ncbi:amino acid permease [Salinibacterium sp. TMP30]|uniref:amino acid permease n=1 Tax=Salinibacterium sp. TMP30 TaxID=3138237 RepID=UPI00313A3CA1
MPFLRSRVVLLLAFAFTLMADPVSSVAYAVEAALRALDGRLDLLVATMGLVVSIIALVVLNYRALIARYPEGGGASAAVGEAFGDGWSFLPVGSLVVDFVLTIAISVSAAASAVIAYFPVLAPWRLLIALALVAVVGGLSLFGNLGRILFALMTVSFVAVAASVLLFSVVAAPLDSAVLDDSAAADPNALAGAVAVILAFPVAMALATGVEAPSTAIAQLGGLDSDGRRWFGQLTLWLTLGIVSVLTLTFAVQATRLGISIPDEGSTLIADFARHVAPAPLFGLFQLMTALLLLAAASSSFQAGPGLLKALAVHPSGTNAVGILPAAFGSVNRRHTPYWGLVLFTALSMVVLAATGADDQRLVLFYAVAVFLSFLSGLLAMARFTQLARQRKRFVLNVVGAAIVAFTLIVNLARGWPLVSLAAAALIAATLWALWVRAGRPEGIRSIESLRKQDGDGRDALAP